MFEQSNRLDFELELVTFICRGNAVGKPISAREAEEYIFGYTLMNDWSARDIQAWEYVQLGPFNTQDFGTTISSWVVLADALEPSRTRGLSNDVDLVDYLRQGRLDNVLDIKLEVSLQTSEGNQAIMTRTSSKNLLWPWSQMIAHYTMTGYNLKTGDLLGLGTIPGTDQGTQGSMLEQTKEGKTSIRMGGEEHTFLEDGDTIIIRGWSGSDKGNLVGFGECRGQIIAASSREES